MIPKFNYKLQVNNDIVIIRYSISYVLHFIRPVSALDAGHPPTSKKLIKKQFINYGGERGSEEGGNEDPYLNNAGFPSAASNQQSLQEGESIQPSSVLSEDPSAGGGRDAVSPLGGEGGDEGNELGAILNSGRDGGGVSQGGMLGEVGLSKEDESVGAFNEPTAADLGDQRHMVDSSNGQGES